MKKHESINAVSTFSVRRSSTVKYIQSITLLSSSQFTQAYVYLAVGLTLSLNGKIFVCTPSTPITPSVLQLRRHFRMRCLDLATHNERQGLSTFPVERSGTTEQNEFCGVYFVYTLNGINYKLGRYRGIAAAKSIHPAVLPRCFSYRHYRVAL